MRGGPRRAARQRKQDAERRAKPHRSAAARGGGRRPAWGTFADDGHASSPAPGRARPGGESGSRSCRTRRSSRCRRPPPCDPDRLPETCPGCPPAGHASTDSHRTARGRGRWQHPRCGTGETAAARATASRPAVRRRSAWRRARARCASFLMLESSAGTWSLSPGWKSRGVPPSGAMRSSISAPARQPRGVGAQASRTQQPSCSLVRK